MDLNLTGKKVIVTGASRGLGLEISSAFAKEGAKVTLCSRNRRSLSKAEISLKMWKDNIYTYSMDATKQRDIEKCIEYAQKHMNGIDIIVNNVGGVERYAGFFDVDENEYIAAFKLNVLSTVNFTRFAYKYLKKSLSPRIIIVSSLTGLQPGIFNPHYSVSKAAVINLSKQLANLLAKDNILVNSIVAGTFYSDSWKNNIQRVAFQKKISFSEAEAEETNLVVKGIPLNRIGKVNEITPTVLLLASDLSSWTTGACLVIDGGKTRSIH